jgi:hypothetical protein
VGTVNVDSRALACPLLLWRCARGGPLPYTTTAPDQDADRISFPIRRSEDHIPNIKLSTCHSSGVVGSLCLLMSSVMLLIVKKTLTEEKKFPSIILQEFEFRYAPPSTHGHARKMVGIGLRLQMSSEKDQSRSSARSPCAVRCRARRSVVE